MDIRSAVELHELGANKHVSAFQTLEQKLVIPVPPEVTTMVTNFAEYTRNKRRMHFPTSELADYFRVAALAS